MSIARTRGLSPEFIKDVLPNIQHPPMEFGEFNREFVDKKMAALTVSKEKAMRTHWPHLLTSVKTEDFKVAMRDGYEVDVRFYRPAGDSAQAASKQVVYSMHGGFFIGGGIESEDLINRQLCHVNGLLIFSIAYRLAPESHVFPTTYNDVEDGFLWTSRNSHSYGGDVSRGIILSGTSAGGASVACLAYRAPSLGIKVSGCLMRQPCFIFGKYNTVAKKEWLPRLKSMEENADCPFMNAAICYEAYKMINFPIAELQNPYNCPIYGSREQLAKMPKTYICKAPIDPVADEVELYADLLRDAGVDCKVKEYPGMPHGFHAHHILKCARDEMVDTGEAIKWLMS